MAAVAKNHLKMLHKRVAVIAPSSLRLPATGVPGFHFSGVTGRPGSGRAPPAPWAAAHLAGLGTLADHFQPLVPMVVDFDLPQLGADQLLGAQTSGVGEVEHESQPLCRDFLPMVGPLQTVSDRAREAPFAVGERPAGVHRARPRATHLDPGEGVGQDVALLDQPAEHRAEHGQGVGGRPRRQLPSERPPVW